MRKSQPFFVLDGELEKAEYRLRDVIERCHGTGYAAGLPRAYYHIASVFARQKRTDEALQYAEMASKAAVKTDRNIIIASQILIWRLKNLKMHTL